MKKKLDNACQRKLREQSIKVRLKAKAQEEGE